MSAAIFSRWSDNVLLGSVVSSTVAPLSSYSLDTLLLMNPAARVLFGATSVTVTFTLSGPALGDVLVIPMHNLDAGSSVLTLTNGAGFSAAITIPAYRANGFPATLVVDLTALAGTRTSNIWNLVIAGNSVDVVLGGAVAIYSPKRDFSSFLGGNFATAFDEVELAHVQETKNEYGTPFIQDYETVSRSITLSASVTPTEAAALLDWHRVNHGSARPSLLWPDPSVSEAYFGRWQPSMVDASTSSSLKAAAFQQAHVTEQFKTIRWIFDEWPKGKPIG